MALPARRECLCHAHESDLQCSLWREEQSQSWNSTAIPPAESPMELDRTIVEQLITSLIQCHLCKAEGLETIRALTLSPHLSIPIHYIGSPWATESVLWLLSAHAVSSKKLTAKRITSRRDIPVLADFASSRDDIYRFLYQQSGGGVLCQDSSILNSSLPQVDGGVGDEVAKLVRTIFSKARDCLLTDDNLLSFVRQLDYVFDAISVGYFFLRLFHPETTTLDLIWIVNNHRQDQADFFTQCADFLKSNGLPITAVWDQLCSKFQDCFDKTLKIFDHQQIWNALSPLLVFTELLIKAKRDLSSVREYMQTARAIAEQFLPADRWDKFQQDSETFTPFLGGIVPLSGGIDFSSAHAQILSYLKNKPAGAKLVREQEIKGWYGIGKIPLASLHEAAERFWETRTSDYHQANHDFLTTFVSSARAQQSADISTETSTWDTYRYCVDAIFSIKIGLAAYGELDWILARCFEVRLCKSVLGDGLIHQALSHVVSRYLLPLELAAQSAPTALNFQSSHSAASKPPGREPRRRLDAFPLANATNLMGDIDDASTSDSSSDGMSSTSSVRLPTLRLDCVTLPPSNSRPPGLIPSPSRSVRTSPIQAELHRPLPLDALSREVGKLQPLTNLATSIVDDDDTEQLARRRSTKDLPQFIQEWTGRTNCLVRVPAVYYTFIMDSGELHDIAQRTSAFIDVLRAGKVLAASSSFRIQGKTHEIVFEAVRLFEHFVMHLGLCEQRVRVTKACAAKIVGKGGDRIATIRNQSSCKIIILDAEPAEMNETLVIFVGLPDNVQEGYKLVRRVIVDFETKLRIAPSDRPRQRLPHLVKTSYSEDQSDDDHPVHRTPPRLIPGKSSSDLSDADDNEGTPSPTENTTAPMDWRRLKVPPPIVKLDTTRVPDDALFKAVQHRDWASAANFVERDEGIFFVAASGTTILHKAVERNAPESLIKTLISKGLDPNQAVLKKGFTSLHFAVQANCRTSILEALIAAGGDVNRADEHGSTPAHVAASRNVSARLIDLLYAAGADFSVKDKAGMTPLMLASSHGGSRDLLAAFQRAPGQA